MAKELTLEEKVQRTMDYQEIMNVMSSHSYYHAAGMHEEEFSTIWAKDPGVRWTIHGGVYEGPEAVDDVAVKSYHKRHMQALENVAKWYPIEVNEKNRNIGEMVLHVQSTPIIQVARDGKTAKGVWYSPGMIAGIGPDGKPSARWMWEKYGVDFLKEDGKWKIWHMVNYYDFVIPFGKDFSEVEWPRTTPATVFAFAKATRMQEGGDPYERYHPTRIPQLMPKLPEPYDTWDDSMAY